MYRDVHYPACCPYWYIIRFCPIPSVPHSLIFFSTCSMIVFCVYRIGRKLSREKIFANFVDLEAFVRVFSTKKGRGHCQFSNIARSAIVGVSMTICVCTSYNV